MQDINCRGSFPLSKLSIPHLRKSAKAGRNPHILTLSPPLNLNPRWAGASLGYTIAKYGIVAHASRLSPDPPVILMM